MLDVQTEFTEMKELNIYIVRLVIFCFTSLQATAHLDSISKTQCRPLKNFIKKKLNAKLVTMFWFIDRLISNFKK